MIASLEKYLKASLDVKNKDKYFKKISITKPKEVPPIAKYFRGIYNYLDNYSPPTYPTNKIISIENIFDDVYLDIQKKYATSIQQAFTKEFILLLLSIFLYNRKVDSHFKLVKKLAYYLNPEIQEETKFILKSIQKTFLNRKKKYYTPKINSAELFLSIHFEKCKFYYDPFDDQDIPLCFLYKFKEILDEKVFYTSDFNSKDEVLKEMNNRKNSNKETLIMVGHGNDKSSLPGINLILNENIPKGKKSTSYFTPDDAVQLSKSYNNLILLGCAYDSFKKRNVHKEYKYFIIGDNVTHRKIEVFLSGFLKAYSMKNDFELAFQYGALATMLWEDKHPDIYLYKNGLQIK